MVYAVCLRPFHAAKLLILRRIMAEQGQMKWDSFGSAGAVNTGRQLFAFALCFIEFVLFVMSAYLCKTFYFMAYFK